MARGWESKSVEDQQAEVVSPPDKSRPYLTPEQVVSKRQREGLVLTRKRALQQMETAKHPEHRRMLEKALLDIDSQLAKLG